VLVTGASRGIGAATAKRLAAEGADVAIVARTLDHHPKLRGSLNETAAAMSAYGGQVTTIVADLLDEADRNRIVAAAVAGLGGPMDVLVNNAAYSSYQPITDYPLAEARRTYEVNVVASLQLMSAVIPAMTERGEGWIVNVSSGTARLFGPPPYQPMVLGSKLGVYGASKAALNKVTAALAMELYGTGIRVNTVEPRNAVMSEGAEVVVGGKLRNDQIETMDEMVEAVVALCCCEAEHTGYNDVSLDLIDQLGLRVT
jgi:NAD(P)-dependent dehydrogenase (short-subunit alcohol dehydrogenase family)